eukprot:TRINITY_DN3990_c1_g1_i1.p1 TRINITY_DN3990_c1_g1~~TRINITY_DN3990_c1_g1_i1.p1  ORF type:complete len:355 (-),score=89.79 TRINITY_DN3990_c1_g1_i1:389-1453(-)
MDDFSTSEKLTVDDLKNLFHLTMKEASKKMGICHTTLKTTCSRFGIERWPYLKFKALDEKIMIYERTKMSGSDAIKIRAHMAIEQLQCAKQILRDQPNITVEDAIMLAKETLAHSGQLPQHGSDFGVPVIPHHERSMTEGEQFHTKRERAYSASTERDFSRKFHQMPFPSTSNGASLSYHQWGYPSYPFPNVSSDESPAPHSPSMLPTPAESSFGGVATPMRPGGTGTVAPTRLIVPFEPASFKGDEMDVESESSSKKLVFHQTSVFGSVSSHTKTSTPIEPKKEPSMDDLRRFIAEKSREPSWKRRIETRPRASSMDAPAPMMRMGEWVPFSDHQYQYQHQHQHQYYGDQSES